MNTLYLQAAAQMAPADFTILRQQLAGDLPGSIADRHHEQNMGALERRKRGAASGIADSPAHPGVSRKRPASVRPTDSTLPPESGAAVSGADAGNPLRTRQYQQHDWPVVGTILTAEYYGQRYQATVIPAKKKLLSGRQLRIDSGPAEGEICDSLSAAMIVATEAQRRKLNLRRKGVANGWDFWQWEGK